MSKGKKLAIAIVIDFILIAAIVFAVKMIISGDATGNKRLLCQGIIVVAIPIMFYMTYMSAAGDKYDELPAELLDDEDELSDEVISDSMPENIADEPEVED